jgi:DNA-binding HxlR family transcriptional regulator
MLKTRQDSAIECPIQFTLAYIGGKWTLLILRELFAGDCRTHEFLEALSGISSKTLTKRLRELEAHGLIERRIYPEIPPRVEYSLTEKGRELQPVMSSLYQVGQRWLERDDGESSHQAGVATQPERAAQSSSARN